MTINISVELAHVLAMLMCVFIGTFVGWLLGFALIMAGLDRWEWPFYTFGPLIALGGVGGALLGSVIL